ncbi:hypothetical protein ACHAXS_011093 [Conticribra weissflogii]
MTMSATTTTAATTTTKQRIHIPSYPPSQPRPTTAQAARHICEEARLVLTSLRTGPPYVARGEMAWGLRELRSTVRGRFLDLGGDAYHPSVHHAHLQPQQWNAEAAKLASSPEDFWESEKDDHKEMRADVSTGNINPIHGTPGASPSPAVRSPPPPSPQRTSSAMRVTMSSSIPLPLCSDGDDNEEDEIIGTTDDNASLGNVYGSASKISDVSPGQPDLPTPECPATPRGSISCPPTDDSNTMPPPPSTPHSVAPPSPALKNTTISNISNPLPEIPKETHLLDPGPYARPFLAVIVDPRAAGPHTLVALRALHRLLERGSIVQLSSSGSCSISNSFAGNPDTNTKLTEEPTHIHQTSLEPIARGVLACRFEQTDAGADEAVEMAIADLLRLLVELDAAGARAAEAFLVRQALMNKRQKTASGVGGSVAESASTNKPSNVATSTSKPSSASNTNKPKTLMRVQRLPATVIMEAFHSVFVTRHTFVRDGALSATIVGHHSPALSFHFEQVLMKMIHCVFGGEDATSPLTSGGSSGGGNNAPTSLRATLSSRNATAARIILEFLVDQLLIPLRGGSSRKGEGVPSSPRLIPTGSDTHDGRILCLRLVQCCLKTGFGDLSMFGVRATGVTGVEKPLPEDEMAILRTVEDELCLALLTTGQSIWAHHDQNFSGVSTAAATGAAGMDVSLDVLSEVCATLSLLWSLPRLRIRLRAQFESIFSGFYQRALSLLRRRPLPEDGLVFQANLVFDSEAEIILESLVDILCLHGPDRHQIQLDKSIQSLSALEELFAIYDCSMTESDVASGLLVELSRCCGGTVDEEGESIAQSFQLSRSSSSVLDTPGSNGDIKRGSSASLVARYRPVPDHLKELCSEALLGSIRRLFRGVESFSQQPSESKGGNTTALKRSSITISTCSMRNAKNRKRHLRHAAKLFNEKSSKGLQYLLDNGIFPNPVDPQSISSFLRNGLVVGLDKAAVGQYLGEVGKAETPGKVIPAWECDWFHKEVLLEYCSSFGFEGQTLLDGLRTFLAAFRLPGEAQMIDRILQAFADSCGRVCEESMKGSLKLFSPDEKRASDAAYLLSFSIIMLNTDLHNDNIRADRKMKLEDFIRNNTNYGKDITDEGKDLPRDYLEGIYRNIKEEQIRTLGEGADGSMTVERWKDVMRSAKSIESQQHIFGQDVSDAKNLKELLLESAWQPILSAISGLWGSASEEFYELDGGMQNRDGTYGVQSVRIGIDLAHEILSSSSNLGRSDIFQDLFNNICYMSGLLGEYNGDIDQRANRFIYSIERQSALTVATNIAEEAGDIIGLDGWKCVWGMIFELRDLQLLSTKGGIGRRSIISESDPDLLTIDARNEFYLRMVREMQGSNGSYDAEGPPRKATSFFGSFFSSSARDPGDYADSLGSMRSINGKGDQLVWDYLSSSDDEDENESSGDEHDTVPFFERSPPQRGLSIGAAFENQLIYESSAGKEEMPVTGLERIGNDLSIQLSPRARVRHRLSQLVDFSSLISESRYLHMDGLSDLLNALVEMIRDSSKNPNNTRASEGELASLPLSPASEAFAEILLCEITLKNRDRFTHIWENVLCAHYNSRLTYRPSWGRQNSDSALSETNQQHSETMSLTPGIEKCVTGVLRLCIYASSRNTLASEVLTTLKILHPPYGVLHWSPQELNLDKHLAEGLWRICRNVDGLSHINDVGWSGILGLLEWCASRGGMPSAQRVGSLAEDDPSLQAFRSLHLMLHAVELKDCVPFGVVRSIRSIVEAGERAQCPKLSIAGLDLLQVLHSRMESLAVFQSAATNNPVRSDDSHGKYLLECWLPTLEAIGEPAEKSRNGVCRSSYNHSVHAIFEGLTQLT